MLRLMNSDKDRIHLRTGALVVAVCVVLLPRRAHAFPWMLRHGSTQCASCHADTHSGQLGQGCEDCHLPDRWRVVRFDHDRTGWPLRGRHFVTPCVSCHTAQRWVGLVDECWDCHTAAAARGKARAPAAHPFGPLECTNCHTSQWRW